MNKLISINGRLYCGGIKVRRGIIKNLLCFIIILMFLFAGGINVFAAEQSQTDFMKMHPEIINDCEKMIKDAMTKSKIVGLSVALVDDRQILWTKGYGYTDKSKKNPITPDTIFSIQSISKTITATAAMKAVQDGLIDLDKPIKYYLPNFKVDSAFEKNPEDKITIRHLLSHTAGFTQETSIGSNYNTNSPSFEEHIKSISKTWLKFPVGENYSYSNLGIDLVGYILEKQSEMPFWKYVEENITKPIGMINSTFDLEKIKNNKNRARGQSNYYWKVPLEIPIIPSGGFYSSANDMAKFIQFHLNKGVVSKKNIIKDDILKEMYKIPFPADSQTEGYCLGIDKSINNNLLMLNHNGGGFAFLASMTWYPDIKLGVVVLSNTDNAALKEDIEPANISGQILDRIIGDQTTKYYPRTGTVNSNNYVSYENLQNYLISNVTDKLSKLKTVNKSTVKELKGYTGNYVNSMTGIPFILDLLNISEKDGSLYSKDGKLMEVDKGVFYSNTGEVFDFNKKSPTFRNIKLNKLQFPLAGYLVFLIIGIVIFISWPLIGVVNRKDKNNIDNSNKRNKHIIKAILGLNMILILTIIGFALYYLNIYNNIMNNAAKSPIDYYVILTFVYAAKFVPLAVLIFTCILLVLNIPIWKKSYWNLIGRIHYSVIVLFSILFYILLYCLNLGGLIFMS
jgi:CubicO group peptidase (beta-lactamase class C family)